MRFETSGSTPWKSSLGPEMDDQEFKQAANQLIDFAISYWSTLRDRKVLPAVSPGYLPGLIPDEAPQEPEKWDDIFKDIERDRKSVV